MKGLPVPYGTGALEPPDEPATEYEPCYYPLAQHRPERINLVNRCVSCGDIWPCETVED